MQRCAGYFIDVSSRFLTETRLAGVDLAVLNDDETNDRIVLGINTKGVSSRYTSAAMARTSPAVRWKSLHVSTALLARRLSVRLTAPCQAFDHDDVAP
jgi:hypothetical protein